MENSFELFVFDSESYIEITLENDITQFSWNNELIIPHEENNTSTHEELNDEDKAYMLMDNDEFFKNHLCMLAEGNASKQCIVCRKILILSDREDIMSVEACENNDVEILSNSQEFFNHSCKDFVHSEVNRCTICDSELLKTYEKAGEQDFKKSYTKLEDMSIDEAYEVFVSENLDWDSDF